MRGARRQRRFRINNSSVMRRVQCIYNAFRSGSETEILMRKKREKMKRKNHVHIMANDVYENNV